MSFEKPASDKPASPSPRPRSAAARARRIGGGAAAASDTGDKTAAPSSKTPGPDKGAAKPGASAAAKAGEKPATKAAAKSGTKPAAKSTTKSAAKTGAAAATSASRSKAGVDLGKQSRGDDGAGPKRLTLALPGWTVWTPAVLFAAATVVFLVLFGVAHIGGADESSTSTKVRQQVLASAKTCLATLNTYRYDQLDAAEAAGVKCTTGKLTTDYRKTVSAVIRARAPQLKAVQSAKITTAGIESVTGNGKQWTVLAYGQLSITTTNQKQGRVDPFASSVRLQQVKGKWLLSKIDTVSSFSS